MMLRAALTRGAKGIQPRSLDGSRTSTPKAAARTPPAVPAHRKGRSHGNTDELKLLLLGYRQELKREFTLFNNFGTSFTCLSTMTALVGTYGSIGMTFGGPVIMVWGWPVVVLFTLTVALSMSELASAYPTSGALYYWSYRLAPWKWKELACWVTAWMLTLGQAAFTAGNVYTLVNLIVTTVAIVSDYVLDAPQQLGVLVTILFLLGLLNSGPARMTAFITTLGTIWHLVAISAFCVALPFVTKTRQPARYVFTSWQPNHEVTGIQSPVYTCLVGLLMSQWTLLGYDASAHFAEETFDAEYNVPKAIVTTIVVAAVSGYGVILSLTFCSGDAGHLFDPDNETGGLMVVLQILWDSFEDAFGSGMGGVVFMSIPIACTFFCCFQSIAANSRMLYAVARDNCVPFASVVKQVHPYTKAPVAAVVAMTSLTLLLCIPMCFNVGAFFAMTAFAVVGLYISYAMPVAMRMITGRRYFIPGPFYLGPIASPVISAIAVAWVAFISVLFMLPQFYPITRLNNNYASTGVGTALVLSLGWWFFPKYGARHWFVGPQANLGKFDTPSTPAPRRQASHVARRGSDFLRHLCFGEPAVLR